MKVIVIGGGPSGLMAAKMASQHNHDVILIDSQPKVGQKLLMTGNGRCNISNNKEISEFMKHCSKSSRFLYSALSFFGPQEIIQFFKEAGCPLVEEDDNRLFPKSQKARDILNCLMTPEVKTIYNTKIIKINTDENKIVSIESEDKVFVADHYILATGGKSFPVTGSDGVGHRLLKNCGHTITDLVGVEVGLLSEEVGGLQGISLNDVLIKVIVNQKAVASVRDDLIFTHFGLSGPGILKLSEKVVNHLKEDVFIQITLENINLEKGSLSKNMSVNYPKRLVQVLLMNVEDLRLEQTSNQVKETIRNKILNPQFKIIATQAIEKAFVTRGGVKTNEFDPKTMKSKIIDNLSVCGEVLDCHGEVGGYNLTLALSSGYTAGSKI